MLLQVQPNLGDRLAGHVQRAVLPQVDRAVGADQVLAGDRLRAGRAGQLHRNVRLDQHFLELAA